MNGEDNLLRGLIGEMSVMMNNFPEALERRAEDLVATGKDPELAGKLMKGADAMRDSGHIYLNWARHFAALSDGTSAAANEEDEADFGV